MAFCTSCGKQSTPDDRFCKACGAPVATEAPKPPVVAAAPPNIPAEPATPPAETLVIPVHPQVADAPVPPAAAAIFCRACGKPAPAGHDFCGSCGAPLRGNLPVAHAETYALIPPPVSAKRKSFLWLWITAAAVIVVIILAVIIIPFLAGPDPGDSLDQARTAYLQHDQASFDKYVDVDSVLGDWTDQGVNGWLKQQNAGPIETAAAQILAGTMKSAYLPALAQSVDQWVVSGTLPADPSQSDQNDQSSVFVTAFLSSALRTLASSQLTYQGVQSKFVTNNNAELTFNVVSSLSSQPILVHVKMLRVGDHWQVKAVEDLAGLLSQISPTPAP
nr:zinc ribbon domain-containing protein [Candidatus Acidoferrales bacterium]